MLVVTDIGSRLCCDMSKVIFIMMYLVKTDSLYAFDRHYFSVLYRIEAIMKYCEINFLNLLVKVSMSLKN